MFKDITLGQYFPGDSVLHRADPRFKLVALILYLVFVLLADSAAAIGIVLLVTVVLAILSHIPARVLMRSLKPIVFLLLFTGLLNLFFTTGETPLWEWKFLHIYPEGIRMAVFMLLRLVCLICGSSLLLSFTTSPLQLTDAIESLFSPLKVLHVPVHEFAMMMTIALRFIPTLTEETDKIMSAQKARGADLESGGLIKKAKAMIPILIPLFVSAFRRADELAEAMECRCYHGGEGRTKLNVMHFRFSDVVFLTVLALAMGAVIPANLFLQFRIGLFTI